MRIAAIERPDEAASAPAASRLYQLAFVNFFGWYLIVPILPLFLTTITNNPALIGLVIASASLFPLFLAFPIGVVADRVPPRWLGIAGTGGMIIAAIGFAAGGSITAALTFQLFHGLSQLVIVLTIQTALYRAGGASFETLFGRYTFWASLGQITSPLIAGLAASALLAAGATAGQAYRAVFAGTALVYVAAVAICWRLPSRYAPAPQTSAVHPRSRFALLRSPGMSFVMLASAGLAFAFDARRSFFPIYLRELGMTPTVIGVLFSIWAISAALVRPFLGIASDRWGSSRLLVGVLIAGTVGWIVVTLSHSWWLALPVLVLGVAQGFGHPLTMSLVIRAVPGRMGGAGLGLRQMFNQAAQIASPLLLGLAVSHLHTTAIAFFIAAAVLISVAGLARPRSQYYFPSSGIDPGEQRVVAEDVD